MCALVTGVQTCALPILAHEKSYNAGMTNDSIPNPTIGGTPRAVKRPAHMKAPAGWTNSAVPAPRPIVEHQAEDQPSGRNPVRYGDWELKGVAVDLDRKSTRLNSSH